MGFKLIFKTFDFPAFRLETNFKQKSPVSSRLRLKTWCLLMFKDYLRTRGQDIDCVIAGKVYIKYYFKYETTGLN